MYLCIAFEKSTSVKLKKFGSLAQLNRASDYGSEGYRFESCRSHKNQGNQFDSLFLFSATKHQPPPVKLSKFSGQPYFRLSGKILGD